MITVFNIKAKFDPSPISIFTKEEWSKVSRLWNSTQEILKGLLGQTYLPKILHLANYAAILNEIGCIYYHKRNYYEAREYFLSAAKEKTNCVEIKINLALSHYANKNIKLAIDLLDEDSNNYLAMMAKAFILYQESLTKKSDDTTQIELCLDKAIACDPNQPNSYFVKAIILFNAKKDVEKVKILALLETLSNMKNIDSQLPAITYMYAKYNKIEEAVRCTDRIFDNLIDLKNNRIDIESLFLCINVYIEAKQIKKIDSIYLKLEQNKDLTPLVNFIKTYVALRQRDLKLASENFQNISFIEKISFNTQTDLHPELNIIKGIINYYLGNKDIAYASFKEVLPFRLSSKGNKIQLEVQIDEPIIEFIEQVCSNFMFPLVKAIIFKKQENYKEAKSQLSEVFKMDSGFLLSYLLMTEVCEKLKDFSEMDQCCDKALQLDKLSYFAMSKKAFILLQKKEYIQALAWIEKALQQTSPVRKELLSMKEEALVRLEKYEDLIKFIDEGYSKLEISHQTKISHSFAKARAAESLNKHLDAIKYANEVLMIDPKNIDALNLKALAHRNLNQLKEALATIENALTYNPTQAGALVLKGSCLVALYRFQEGLACIEQAIALTNSKPSWVLLEKSIAHFELFEYTKALKIIEEALTDIPEHVVAIRLKCDILLALNQPQNAFSFIEQALSNKQLDSNKLLPIKGLILIRLQQEAAAIKILSNAIQADDKSDLAFLYRGMAYLEQDALDKAERDIEKALELNPENLVNKQLKCLLLIKQGSLKDALIELDKIFSVHPNFLPAHLTKVAALIKKKDFSGALKHLSKVLQFNPHNLQAMLYQAFAYFGLGQYQEAKDVAKEILKINSTHREALKLNKSIDMFAEFSTAVNKEDIKQIKSLLQDKSCLDSLNNFGKSPLHIAVAAEKLKIVVEILKTQNVIDTLDMEGATPLHYAIRQDQKEIVKKLLKAGASLSMKDKSGNNALHIVAMTTFVNVAELLLKKATTDCFVKNEKGDTPLHLAYFIEQDNKTNKKYMESRRLLFNQFLNYLQSQNDKTKVLAILSYSNSKEDTLLHLAAMHNDISTLTDLLKFGLSANLQNKFGDTPLHKAVNSGCLVSTNFLLSKNARVDLKNNLDNTVFDTIDNLIVSMQIDISEYQTIKDTLINYKENIILNIIKNEISSLLQQLGHEKIIMDTIKHNNLLKLFIANNDYAYLIDTGHRIGKVIQETLANFKWGNLSKIDEPSLTHQVENTIKEAITKVQNKDYHTKMQKDISVLLQYQQMLSMLQPAFKVDSNTEITKEERVFIESLREFLRKYYYTSVALIEEMVRRKLTPTDEKIGVAKQVATYLPALGNMVGEGIASASFLADLTGGISTAVAAKIGPVVGTLSEFLLIAVANIIEKKLDKNARDRAERIVSAFKKLNQTMLDDNKIHAACMEMVLRFRDQINELEMADVITFAERCIGARIISHILKGLNQNVNESTWSVVRFINEKYNTFQQATAKGYIPPTELNIVNRCVLAILHEKDGRNIKVATKTKRTEKNQWYAHGIIELTGRKSLDEKQNIFQYFLTNYSQSDVYGFCYVSNVEIEKDLQAKELEQSHIVKDIFASVMEPEDKNAQTNSKQLSMA